QLSSDSRGRQQHDPVPLDLSAAENHPVDDHHATADERIPRHRPGDGDAPALNDQVPPDLGGRGHVHVAARQDRVALNPRREGQAPGGGANAPADGAGHGHLAARRQQASAHGPAQVHGATRGHHVPLHRAIHRDPAARGVQVVLHGLRDGDRRPAARHERRGRGRERGDDEGARDPIPGPAPQPRHLVTRRSGTGVNRGTAPPFSTVAAASTASRPISLGCWAIVAAILPSRIAFSASAIASNPTTNITRLRLAASIAWTAPSAISSFWAKTASIFFCACRMFSMTARPLARSKSAVWDATSLIPGYFLSPWRNPFPRSRAADDPGIPSSITTLPLPRRRVLPT